VRLYRTTRGVFVEENGNFFAAESNDWDGLIASPGLIELARTWCDGAAVEDFDPSNIVAPVVSQEVWAAGVTYYRSRDARIEESKETGGSTFYDRIYSAVRPELFFKATGRRVVGPGAQVRIRSDAKWSVPEPELALVISAAGEIVGYTIGNDMSSRDIEGENPLYLPQAKVYDGSCALGPCVLLAEQPIARSTSIEIEIKRSGSVVFSGNTALTELKREPKELVEFLFRDNSFPQGAVLLTGTGIVPGDDFTLANGDVIRIAIAGIGVLQNAVA
jgi:2-dehydro-3-deoxy-D-arabinonate dehydratase